MASSDEAPSDLVLAQRLWAAAADELLAVSDGGSDDPERWRRAAAKCQEAFAAWRRLWERVQEDAAR